MITFKEYFVKLDEDYKTISKKFVAAGTDANVVSDLIARFKKLSDNQRLSGPDKNIDSWSNKSFDAFKKFITGIESKVTKSGQKKDSGTSVDITTPEQKAAGWNIIIPTGKSASCYHGTGTDWCVSKPNQDYFEEYFLDNNITLIFCLNDQREKWAIACHVKLSDKSEFFDAKDTTLTQGQFNSQTGLNSAKIIQAALSHAGVDPARAAAKLANIPYLIDHLETPDPALEKKILATKNAKWMYKYVLKFNHRWPAAEPVIAQNAEWAYYYARHLEGERFLAAEPVIAQNAEWAYYYAQDVLTAPWPAAEPVIAQHTKWAYYYAQDVLKDPEPDTWGKRYLAQQK